MAGGSRRKLEAHGSQTCFPREGDAGHRAVLRPAEPAAYLSHGVHKSIHGPLEVSTPSLETDFLGPEMNRHTPQDSPDSATRGPQGNFHMADATQHPNNERLEKTPILAYDERTITRTHLPMTAPHFGCAKRCFAFHLSSTFLAMVCVELQCVARPLHIISTILR